MPIARLLLPSFLLVLSACAGRGPAATPVAAAPGASLDTALGPPDHPRVAHLKHALRGLRYDSGRVEVDAATAAEVIRLADADDANETFARGVALLRRNRRVGAIEALTLCVILAPERAEHYAALGRALFAKGLSAEAAAAFRSALDRAPNRVETRFRLGMALQAGGDFAAAAVAWRDVLRFDPEHVGARIRVAIASYYLEDYASAWEFTHSVEALGESVPPQFRELLVAQMPEPAE